MLQGPAVMRGAGVARGALPPDALTRVFPPGYLRNREIGKIAEQWVETALPKAHIWGEPI